MNNERTSWIVGIVILVVVVIGILIWRANSGAPSQTGSSTQSTSGIVLPYGTVTLGIGESASFQGITITPVSVAEDSRCASGVQCVQAGTVRVVVRSDLQAGPTRQDTVSLGSTTPVDTFSVGLTSVTPSAKAGTTIKQSDYRFTFDVHQRAADGSGLQGKG